MTVMSHSKPNETTLDSCRATLTELVAARAHEQWSREKEIQEMRTNAVLAALSDGWHPATVAEAVGMSEMEVRELSDNHR